jgi:hypothetical protein
MARDSIGAAGASRRSRPAPRPGGARETEICRTKSKSVWGKAGGQGRPLRVGDFAAVKIERATTYDLHGVVVGF